MHYSSLIAILEKLQHSFGCDSHHPQWRVVPEGARGVTKSLTGTLSAVSFIHRSFITAIGVHTQCMWPLWSTFRLLFSLVFCWHNLNYRMAISRAFFSLHHLEKQSTFRLYYLKANCSGKAPSLAPNSAPSLLLWRRLRRPFLASTQLL